MDGPLWYLKQCPLFERLTAPEAAQLNRHARAREYRRKELIYAPTEPGRSILLLARGRVKIMDVTGDGKETIFAFIEEGELFGELAAVDDDPRREFAEAATHARVLMIPREVLARLMAARPDIALGVTKLIGLRRRRVENRLRNVLFLSGRERVLRVLRELLDEYGEGTGDCRGIRLPLSHQDIAGLVGLTRESVTVLLGELQRSGLVAVQRRRITVLHCQRLQELLDGPAADPGLRTLRPVPTVAGYNRGR